MKEIINQLENLRSHCEDMRERDGVNIWAKDAAALAIAINFIKTHAEENPTFYFFYLKSGKAVILEADKIIKSLSTTEVYKTYKNAPDKLVAIFENESIEGMVIE